MRVGQTSVLLSASKYVGSLIGFLATIYFARLLGAEVLGYYALILVVTKWLSLTGDIGIGSAVNKRISEEEEPSAYYSAGIAIAVGLGSLLVLVIVLIRDEINAYVGIEAWVFVALITPLAVIYSIIGSTLKGERRVHLVAFLTPTQTIGRSVMQIALVFAGYELTGMVFGYIAGFVFATCLGLWFISLELTVPKKKHVENIYSFAKFSWLGNLRGRAFNDVDIMVLGVFVVPELVGIYSVAWSVTSFIGIFGSSIKNTLFPELSYADVNQESESFSTLISDSLTYSGLVAIPGLFGSIIIADRLLRIYGEGFARGGAVLSLMILAMLIYDYQNQFLNGLNALDRPDVAFRVNAIFIVVNLTLNTVLVYTFGWTGAAVATVLATIVGVSLAFRYCSKMIDFDIPTTEFGHQLLAGLVMAVVVGVARFGAESILATVHNAAFVIGLVGLGVGVYFTTLLLIAQWFRTTVRNNTPIRISFVP